MSSSKSSWELYKENPDRHRFTLDKLENFWYKLDRENVRRYILLCERRCKGRPEEVKEAVYRMKGGEHRAPPRFMSWKLIAAVADWYGVPAELLIDEDYYFKRCGVAGYRLVFEAYRRGISMERLTKYPDGEKRIVKDSTWYRTWWVLFTGHLTNLINASALNLVLRVCYERLGVPLGSILGRQIHSNSSSVGVYGELVDAMAVLGGRECALLAGVAKLLCDHVTLRGKNTKLVRNVNKLLRWYCGGEIKEKKGRGTAVAGSGSAGHTEGGSGSGYC